MAQSVDGFDPFSVPHRKPAESTLKPLPRKDFSALGPLLKGLVYDKTGFRRGFTPRSRLRFSLAP